MTKTTTYKAPDRKTGFNNGDLTAILANHHPAAEVRTIANWSRRITQLEITEPDEPARACATGPTLDDNFPNPW